MPPKKMTLTGARSRGQLDTSPSRILTKGLTAKAKRTLGSSADIGMEEVDYVPFQARAPLKPEDQLTLVPDALKEEYPRMLNMKNPQMPSNLVEYSFRQGAFLPIKLSPNSAVVLLDYEGCVLHIESDEAQLQLKYGSMPTAPSRVNIAKRESTGEDDEGEGGEGDHAPEQQAAEEESPPEGEEGAEEGQGEGAELGEGGGAELVPGEGEGGEEAPVEGEGEEGEEGEEAPPLSESQAQLELESESNAELKTESESKAQVSPTAADDDEAMYMRMIRKPKKIWNEFNFCERDAMSYNNPFRDMQNQTIPPCIETFSSQIMQWIIFDSYELDFETQQKQKEAEKDDLAFGKHHDQMKGNSYKDELKAKEEKASALMRKTLLAAKTIERMICQNIYDEIAQDFRYWEDPADNYCEEGTLLPLWRFTFEPVQRQTVTSLCWNPCYFDFFAVSYGFYSFARVNTKGTVCMFSLKNPSYPEFTCHRESGVMSVDVHPSYPTLIVVGTTDGNVAVYNLLRPSSEVQIESNTTSGKHVGIVWQVRWAPDTPDNEINFFSISSDGNVFNWILMYDRLEKTLILPLSIPGPPVVEPDGTLIHRSQCGSAMAFHPTNPLVFLAGTEEGPIYQCSILYSSAPLLIYYGHTMPVHRVHYNTYFPGIFLSCSGDWRVIIWEDGRAEPLFVFDLGCAVGDVEWAPFSSTLFAAVTLDGRVCVYDLSLNKYEPVCSQFVVSKRKNILTKIAFNDKFPFIVVGDDKGCVTALKFSPNLRKKVKPPKKGPIYSERELEIIKLERILASVLEPVVLELPETELVPIVIPHP